MDKKITSILAYVGILCGALGVVPNIKLVGIFLPLIVWCVAYFVGDKNGAKVHLNQSLILVIVNLAVGIVCWIIGSIEVLKFIADILSIIVCVATIVLAILGLVAAIKDENKTLPIIGDIKILK